MTEILRTPSQRRRIKKDLTIYKEYKELASVEGNSMTEINKWLCDKYDCAQSTIYAIIRRVEQRQLKEGAL